MRPLFANKSTLLVLGAAAALGASAASLPVRADVHQIGAVNVSADHYTDISWSRFEGPVERLRFVPIGDTVDCDHISVTYRDGTTHDVFSGTMVKDSVETITFPEGDSRIRHVDFTCRAESVDGARIALSSVSAGYDDDDWSREPHVTTYESGEIVR
ncbi:MAG TPA: hypothetical protein VHC40_00830 [Rhizomicrobium sp.]|jgi:hypothetical protein|nr:hypothetical protein [Rhizomicrobium sp.]